MKKLMQMVLAATLICGTTTFTSCSMNDDNSSEVAQENRKAFIKHTRENLKEIAENLNFASWEIANKINQEFNMSILNNPDFEKAIIPSFKQKIQENIQPVEEGSELAQMGYKQYSTVDLTDFNYRFTQKADGSGFDVEEAENFEMIINGINPETQQMEVGMRKVTLQAYGDTYQMIAKRLSNADLAVVILVPTDFAFTISAHVFGTWHEAFKGSFANEIRMNGASEFVNMHTDIINISGHLSSAITGNPGGQYSADATDLYFALGSNPVDNENNMNFTFKHNDKNMIDLGVVARYTDKQFDLSQLTTARSMLDVLAALLIGSDLQANITLNDDLTTILQIKDCGKLMQLQREMAHARRNYADQATIEGYTKQLNEYITGYINCKDLQQSIPMQWQTEKFGIDYWAMPAFNFADEKGFVPFTQLLDRESIEYGINIIDHAAEPMAGAIITVRQLLQFVMTTLIQVRASQAQPAANE